MEPRIDIIVLSYNGRDDSLECLHSLRLLRDSNYRVLFVDNGSADGSLAVVQARFADWPQLVTLRNEHNLGIAGGNNTGLRYALTEETPLVMTLSNDTIVHPEFLRGLRATLAQSPACGVVAAKICYYSDRNRVWFAGARFNQWTARAPFVQEGHRLLRTNPDRSFAVDTLLGCNMLIRREVLETVGLFDERYFFQNEDLDFCYRVKAAGWRIMVCPQSIIWHKIGRTIGAGSYDRWYYATRNRFLFLNLNLAEPQRTVATVFYMMTRIPRLLAWGVGGRLDLARATLDGWHDYRRQHFGLRSKPQHALAD